MPAKVTIKINKAAETARIKEAGNAALTENRDDMIDTINQYVPISGGNSQNGGGGDLRSSAELHSDQQAADGKLTIRWDTPYAQYQNKGLVMHGTPPRQLSDYGPDKLHYTNSMARAEWEKYAAEQHSGDLALALERSMKNHL